MAVGSCHCGRVTIALDRAPDEVTDCNCSSCTKHGARWAYFAPSEVRIDGATTGYRRADTKVPATELNFCAHCGCTTHWEPTEAYVRHAGPAVRIGVNMRLFDEQLLAGVAVRQVDGRDWDVNEDWGPPPSGEESS